MRNKKRNIKKKNYNSGTTATEGMKVVDNVTTEGINVLFFLEQDWDRKKREKFWIEHA